MTRLSWRLCTVGREQRTESHVRESFQSAGSAGRVPMGVDVLEHRGGLAVSGARSPPRSVSGHDSAGNAGRVPMGVDVFHSIYM